MPGYDPDRHQESVIADRAIPNVIVAAPVPAKHASGIDELVAKLLAVALHTTNCLSHQYLSPAMAGSAGTFTLVCM